MEAASTLQFAAAARALGAEARARGLVAPSFRSPPRLPGTNRTIRRRPGGPVVAVAVKGRPWAAVLADMIEGVVVANQFVNGAADQLRTALWVAAGPPSPRLEGQARVA